MIKKKPASYCKDGKCSNCDNCCTEFLPMTKEEVETIKDYVKLHNIQMHRHFEGKNLYMRCPFRDSENKVCTIYPVRPQICKNFICNQKLGIIEANRNKAHKKAFYNHLDKEQTLTNIASLHALIYEDYKWEIQALWCMCEGNAALIQDLLKRCYAKYRMDD